MRCMPQIEKLRELESWIADGSRSDVPISHAYVYYCEVCDSVLAVRSRLDYPQIFLYATKDTCPTCNFRLENTLRCRVLDLRIPTDFFAWANVQDALQSTTMKAVDFGGPPQSDDQLLSFGDRLLDALCGGVFVRQLTLLRGERTCQEIAERLCVRAQLPIAIGGFDASSVLIDGGNMFNVYNVSNYAEALQLDLNMALRRIKISRAFTCYQLLNLVVEQLPKLLHGEEIRLVVILGLLNMFEDPELEFNESCQTVNFLSAFLARLAWEHRIALVVACPSRKHVHDDFFQRLIMNRAQLVLKTERLGDEASFILEKHPTRQWPAKITSPTLNYFR